MGNGVRRGGRRVTGASCDGAHQTTREPLLYKGEDFSRTDVEGALGPTAP